MPPPQRGLRQGKRKPPPSGGRGGKAPHRPLREQCQTEVRDYSTAPSGGPGGENSASSSSGSTATCPVALPTVHRPSGNRTEGNRGGLPAACAGGVVDRAVSAITPAAVASTSVASSAASGWPARSSGLLGLTARLAPLWSHEASLRVVGLIFGRENKLGAAIRTRERFVLIH